MGARWQGRQDAMFGRDTGHEWPGVRRDSLRPTAGTVRMALPRLLLLMVRRSLWLVFVGDVGVGRCRDRGRG